MVGEVHSNEKDDKKILVLNFLEPKKYQSSKGRLYLSINFKQDPIEGGDIPFSGMILIKSSSGMKLFETGYDRAKLASPAEAKKEYWVQLNPTTDPYVIQLRIADNPLDPDNYKLLRVNVYLPTLEHRPDIIEYLNKECSVVVNRLVNLPNNRNIEEKDEIEDIISI